MAFINPQGMFQGDRVANLSLRARLFFPWFIAASNDFGRMELSYEKIRAQFGRWNDFPSEAEITEILQEFREGWLLFVYVADGKIWGQFDISEKWLPRHKSAASEKSPIPGPGYVEWKGNYSKWKISQIRNNPLLSNNPRNNLQLFLDSGAKVREVEIEVEVRKRVEIEKNTHCVDVDQGLCVGNSQVKALPSIAAQSSNVIEIPSAGPSATMTTIGATALKPIPASRPRYGRGAIAEDEISYETFLQRYQSASGTIYAATIASSGRFEWDRLSMDQRMAAMAEIARMEREETWRDSYPLPANFLKTQPWTTVHGKPKGRTATIFRDRLPAPAPEPDDLAEYEPPAISREDFDYMMASARADPKMTAEKIEKQEAVLLKMLRKDDPS